MNIMTKIKLKGAGLREFYFFQKFGFPSIKKEKISKSQINKWIPSNPIIIDCGAHDGSDSIELYRILGGQVHCFEPVPDIYGRLKRRTEKYLSIHCYQLALSDKNGTQKFFVSEGNSDASSSLLEPKEHLVDHPGVSFSKSIDVTTITLDDWAAQQKIAKVDLLWLDMQGYELQMLKASQKILSTVSAIHSEVSTKETYDGVALYDEYRKFLEGKGFQVAIEAIPEGWDMGNVLFVRK